MARPKFNFNPSAYATKDKAKEENKEPSLSSNTETSGIPDKSSSANGKDTDPAGTSDNSTASAGKERQIQFRPIQVVDLEERARQRNITNDAFKFKFIPREKLRPNLKNDYDMTGIDKLEDSILENGLLQNLVVIYSMDEDKYIIESGHRRCQALDNLIARYKDYIPGDDEEENRKYEKYKNNIDRYRLGYPCKIADSLDDYILYDYDSETPLSEIPKAIIDSEIRLIVSNEEVREVSPAQRARNIQRLHELLAFKNAGRSKAEKMNINKEISKNTGLSESQVKNYQSVNKLIPELLELFDQNQITLKDSSNYARLSEDEQRMILSLIRSGEKVSHKEVDSLIKEKKQLSDQLNAKESMLAVLEADHRKLREKLDKAEKAKQASPAEDKKSKEELASKEQEILRLKKELEEAKKKQKEAAEQRKTFSAKQSKIAKADLAARTAYESCRKEIRTFMEAVNELSLLSADTANAEDIKGMGIPTRQDILSMIGQLKEMLNESEATE